jgi:hypothetical protein
MRCGWPALRATHNSSREVDRAIALAAILELNIGCCRLEV